MLKGKVAVVTGGSRGIGRAICEKFADNGASVAVLSQSGGEAAAQLIELLASKGVKAQAYTCNVASFNDCSSVFKQIVKDFGTVDILVNNAGITKDKLMLAMKEQDFDDVLSVNLKGAFNMIKQAYPVFAKQRSGKIINISSISGLIGNSGQANYSASKAGLIGLTKTVARELASRGVTCNAIAPGFIKTDMTAAFTEETGLASSIPMGRMGLPEDVAALALFLASKSSDYITGEVIRVDGGLAM